ncbi:MAG: acyl-CoA dehydrogenase, partial [Cyanobacteria bacterium J06635_1]
MELSTMGLYLLLIIPSLVVFLIGLAYIGVPLWVWTLYTAALFGVLQVPLWGWIPFGIFALVLNLPIFRRHLLTAPIVKTIKALKLFPKISET